MPLYNWRELNKIINLCLLLVKLHSILYTFAVAINTKACTIEFICGYARVVQENAAPVNIEVEYHTMYIRPLRHAKRIISMHGVKEIFESVKRFVSTIELAF